MITIEETEFGINMSVAHDQLVRSRSQSLADGDAAAENSPNFSAEEACADEPREPCPTPLAWQDVLEVYRAESSPWCLERDGTTVSGRVWGEGRPLYFLNGLSGSSELFALLVWVLRDEFRCVLYDYPARQGGSPSDYAADLFAVAALHGDDRFDVFATGFGSVVAMTAMLEATMPDCDQRIARAVLQGGYARQGWSLMERAAIRAGSWTSRPVGRVPMALLVLRANHLPWFPPFDQSRYEFFEADVAAVPACRVAERAAVLRGCDLRPRLGEIDRPVLLVRTEGEGAVGTARQRELEEGIPGAQSEWLHSSGTVPFLTHPHRVRKLIQGFLCDDPPANASATSQVQSKCELR